MYRPTGNAQIRKEKADFSYSHEKLRPLSTTDLPPPTGATAVAVVSFLPYKAIRLIRGGGSFIQCLNVCLPCSSAPYYPLIINKDRPHPASSCLPVSLPTSPDRDSKFWACNGTSYKAQTLLNGRRNSNANFSFIFSCQVLENRPGNLR